MNVARFLGKILSEKTGKKIMPCTGIFRICANEADKNIDLISVSEIKAIVNMELKERLNLWGIEDIDDIINYINSKLIENRSIFAMAKI